MSNQASVNHTQAIATPQQLIELLGVYWQGHPEHIKLSLCCYLAGGHLLLQGPPGTGKTLLALLLSRLLNLSFGRVQCTADLLPGDITGVPVYQRSKEQFEFRPGPVFHECLLVDELNRAPPKSQSALLEAMAEAQVTVDNQCYPLPDHFFVIATQNEQHEVGTFPLPRAQLDRFLLSLEIPYPTPEQELQLLQQGDVHKRLPAIEHQCEACTVAGWRAALEQIAVAEPVYQYITDLLSASRQQAGCGLSTRAGIGIVQMAKAYALVSDHQQVLPDHVQAVFLPCTAHRLASPHSNGQETVPMQQLLQSVPIR